MRMKVCLGNMNANTLDFVLFSPQGEAQSTVASIISKFINCEFIDFNIHLALSCIPESALDHPQS